MPFFNETVKLSKILEALFADRAMLSENADDFFAKGRAILGKSSEVKEGLGDLAGGMLKHVSDSKGR